MSMNEHKIHCVYFIPTDKEPVAYDAIEYAMLHMQRWLRWRLGGKTFTLTTPIVDTRRTQHSSTWYSTNPLPPFSHASWYWENCLNELRDVCGGGFGQPFDSWVVYIDAPRLPGQFAGGTSGPPPSRSGVAILGDWDVAGVQGLRPESKCRWYGGGLHETLHTLSVAHPPLGDPLWQTALMGSGYTLYPNCVLTQVNYDLLKNDHPFITNQRPFTWKFKDCPFKDSGRIRPPAPTARPHA